MPKHQNPYPRRERERERIGNIYTNVRSLSLSPTVNDKNFSFLANNHIFSHLYSVRGNFPRDFASPCGYRDSLCGSRESLCGYREAPCGSRESPNGSRDSPCGSRDSPCGSREALCGSREALCGSREAPSGGREALCGHIAVPHGFRGIISKSPDIPKSSTRLSEMKFHYV